ncbi:MAG: glycosyltransferase [Endomicrobiia bacterium]|jgi:GT2 family glycosyltransferase|nr:glycosyltransferase [Endomicrobiaceae bacterium]
MITITTLIISNKRYDYLKETIYSLMKFNSNIFIVVNGFNNEIVIFLEEIKLKYQYINFTILHDKINKSDARNVGVENINTDLIYFLDDDAFIDKNNIQILQEKFETYPLLGVIGGPNLTPINSTKFEKISGIMLSTYLLSWKMSHRYVSIGKDRYTDDSELILCNLAIKKDLFTKYNLKFEKLLHYNEENLLLEELKNNNVKILYSPDLSVYHHRRSSLLPFSLQVFYSGKGRALMTFFIPSSLRLFHLLPSIFIFYLIALYFGKMTFILLFIYLLVSLYNVLFTAILYNINIYDIALMLVITFISHLSYGIGFITGIIQGTIWKIKKIF